MGGMLRVVAGNVAFIAAWENRLEIMRLLLKHGMNASACAAHDHWGPLHKAAEMSNDEIVWLLLEIVRLLLD